MSERLKRLQARQELLKMWDEVEPSKNEEIARRALDIAYRYLVKSDNQADHIAALEKCGKSRWIPVTERLPEDGVTVWVTVKGHDVIRCEDGETLEQAVARISKIRWVTQGYWSEEEHGWNDPSFGCPLMVQPVAWMPMEVPEPWKEGQNETN